MKKVNKYFVFLSALCVSAFLVTGCREKEAEKQKVQKERDEAAETDALLSSAQEKEKQVYKEIAMETEAFGEDNISAVLLDDLAPCSDWIVSDIYVENGIPFLISYDRNKDYREAHQKLAYRKNKREETELLLSGDMDTDKISAFGTKGEYAGIDTKGQLFFFYDNMLSKEKPGLICFDEKGECTGRISWQDVIGYPYSEKEDYTIQSGIVNQENELYFTFAAAKGTKKRSLKFYAAGIDLTSGKALFCRACEENYGKVDAEGLIGVSGDKKKILMTDFSDGTKISMENPAGKDILAFTRKGQKIYVLSDKALYICDKEKNRITEYPVDIKKTADAENIACYYRTNDDFLNSLAVGDDGTVYAGIIVSDEEQGEEIDWERMTPVLLKFTPHISEG